MKPKKYTKAHLKQLSKQEWMQEHFDGCPFFIQMTHKGFTTNLYDSDISAYNLNLCYFEHREGDWLTSPKDHQRIGSFLVKKFIQNKNSIYVLHKHWHKNFKKMMIFYYKAFETDLSVPHKDCIQA